MRTSRALTGLAPIVAAVGLGGCAGGDESTAAAPPPATGDSTVFEPLTDTLDRAAGVEDTLRDAAAERRRQLEAAE